MKKYGLLCVMLILFGWGTASGYSKYASDCDTSVSCASCHSDGRTCATYVTPDPTPTPTPDPTPSPSTNYATFSSDGILTIPACDLGGEFWSVTLQISSFQPILFVLVDAAPVYDIPSTYSTFTSDAVLNIPELDIAGEIWNCSLQLIAIEPNIVFHLFMAQGGGNYYYDDSYYYNDNSYYDDDPYDYGYY